MLKIDAVVVNLDFFVADQTLYYNLEHVYIQKYTTVS